MNNCSTCMSTVVRWHAEAQRAGAGRELDELKQIAGQLTAGRHLSVVHRSLPAMWVEVEFIYAEYERVLNELRNGIHQS